MLHKLCKQYRQTVGATLKDIEGSESIALLSHFENGRSSNLAHFAKYLRHSIKTSNQEIFWAVIKQGTDDGDK